MDIYDEWEHASKLLVTTDFDLFKTGICRVAENGHMDRVVTSIVDSIATARTESNDSATKLFELARILDINIKSVEFEYEGLAHVVDWPEYEDDERKEH